MISYEETVKEIEKIRLSCEDWGVHESGMLSPCFKLDCGYCKFSKDLQNCEEHRYMWLKLLDK